MNATSYANSPTLGRRSVVVQGIRDGFVAAYDVFRDAAGAELPEGVTSEELAEMLFPVPEEGEVEMKQVGTAISQSKYLRRRV